LCTNAFGVAKLPTVAAALLLIECKVKPSTCYDEYKYQLQVLLVLLCTRHYRGMLALLPYTAMHQALETTTGIEDDGWGTLQQWIVHATMHAQDEIPPRKLNNSFKLLKKKQKSGPSVWIGIWVVSCRASNKIYSTWSDRTRLQVHYAVGSLTCGLGPT
jgi:hypothetical protein